MLGDQALARWTGRGLLLGWGLGAVLLGRLAFDLGRLHPVMALAVGGFYLGFLVVVGLNARSLARGEASAQRPTRGRRVALGLAVPLALLASGLDCMGLELSGCTTTCGVLMRGVGPAIALLVGLHAVTGVRAWLPVSLLGSFALLVPNCVCRNPVNRWWIDLLGQSPACFAASFGVLLLAIAALASGRRVLPSLLLAWGVVTAQLAFWIGHHYYQFPW
jgi:hypothetical protein